MSEDKLSSASKVCLDKLHTHCQAKNSRDLLGAYFKIAQTKKKKSAAFTATYDSGINIDKPRRSGKVEKVQ